MFKINEELNNTTDKQIQEAKLNEFSSEVTKLWEKLMSLEVQVIDQLEVVFFVLNIFQMLSKVFCLKKLII